MLKKWHYLVDSVITSILIEFVAVLHTVKTCEHRLIKYNDYQIKSNNLIFSLKGNEKKQMYVIPPLLSYFCYKYMFACCHNQVPI